MSSQVAEQVTEQAPIQTLQITPKAAPISVTEKAASKVKQIIAEQQPVNGAPAEKLNLRVRVVGGGCSGFQNKLDLDPQINEKLDEVFDFHGIQVVVDKRSLMYLEGAVVDYHDELHRQGFSITNPQAKSTCGCGSSYTM
jgi:iron-sulfur cluster assembly accessory protein